MKHPASSTGDLSRNAIENKTLLLVDAGSPRKHFILKRIRELGVRIVVIDGQKKEWAAPFVDEWIIADTKDAQSCVAAVERYLAESPDRHIDGVTTFWEYAVVVRSAISERFHLPGVPLISAQRARNKNVFREFCLANGLPAPRHVLLKDDDTITAAQALSYPVVIKPIHGGASAFVVKVEVPEQLPATLTIIRELIARDEKMNRAGGTDLLVEEYIDGKEVDIDLLVQNGEIRCCCVSDNMPTKEPYFVETDRVSPSILPNQELATLEEMVRNVVTTLDVRNACVHFEAKMSSRGPMPLEVNLRMGGDEIYSSVRDIWNIDLIEGSVRIALGAPIEPNACEPRGCIISHTFLPERAGILHDVVVSPSLKFNANVCAVEIDAKAGDNVRLPPHSFGYLGWMSVKGENADTAFHHLRQALVHVRFDIRPDQIFPTQKIPSADIRVRASTSMSTLG